MTEEERSLDLMIGELEQENRLLRARNERLEAEMPCMIERARMDGLSRKMAHELANLLYQTKDDLYFSTIWQSANDALSQYFEEFQKAKDKNAK